MADRTEIIDLSHVIEHGMTTYPGLPGPHICDFWERETTAGNYEDGSTFQIPPRYAGIGIHDLCRAIEEAAAGR